MEKEIKVVHEDDVIPSVFEGRESARLITKERENSELCSFHINWVHGPACWSQKWMYPENDEMIYFVKGEAQVSFDGKICDCRPGTIVYIPKGHWCRLRAKTELKTVVIIAPPRLRSEWALRTPEHPESLLQDLVMLEPEDALKKKD